MRNPLRVALIHRDHPRLLDERMIGAWSHDVSQFAVTHFAMPKHFVLNRADYATFDVVIWEDGRTHGEVVGNDGPPVVYCAGDSTLSDEHYAHRYEQASQCDLVLVDWDRLERFAETGKPVRRWSYCVNPRLYRPMAKQVDVGFYAHPTAERSDLTAWLADFCHERGYSLHTGARFGLAYPVALATTRVNINLNRNPQTRAHRCYDVLASQSCLLTSPMPHVSGETWQAGTHYLEWSDYTELAARIDQALTCDTWSTIARAGFMYVQRGHTWARRAKELHALLYDVFPQLEAQTHGVH